MTDCSPTPGTNVSELDNRAFDLLPAYMNGLPAYFAQAQSEYLYGLQIMQTALQYDIQLLVSPGSLIDGRAPLLSHFDLVYGLFAKSLAADSTSGYYGVAEVPTSGSAPQPAYIARTYIIAIAWAMLVLSPFLTILDLVLNLYRHVPLRKATPLTLINAFRGPKWDEKLAGGCVMSDTELRNRYRGCVQRRR
jgi:hypothetical protein